MSRPGTGRSRLKASGPRCTKGDPLSYGRTVQVDMPVSEALEHVREAFQEQGFGTLTEIDLAGTLKEKIGAEIQPYVILGMCNPKLADRAVAVEKEIGLLLPCNVVVRDDDGRTLVQALDPDTMVELTDNEQLSSIAKEATERIDKALEAVAGRSRQRA